MARRLSKEGLSGPLPACPAGERDFAATAWQSDSPAGRAGRGLSLSFPSPSSPPIFRSCKTSRQGPIAPLSPRRCSIARARGTGRHRGIRLALPYYYVLLALVGFAVARTAQADEWKYTVPESREQTTDALYPVPVAQMLTKVKPSDLNEDTAPYRGKVRRYVQIHYGNPSSIRVCFVIDELEDGTADLYVDANRDRRIEKRDRAEGGGPDWEVPLDVAIAHEDAFDLYHRRVSIHRGATGRTLAIATLGYMQGSITVGGRTVTARRVDGDADGMFASASDRLWIDRNADGAWDPFNEQLNFTTIMRIEGERYAARSDLIGHRLSLEPLAGSGSVQLVLPAIKEPGEGASVAATLVARDGTAILVSGSGKPAEVPAGEYQMQIVWLSLPGKDDSRRWEYHFSSDDRRERPWHNVAAGATLELDPIGMLDFVVEVEGDKSACKAGESLTVNPRLYTGDGLLINACHFGPDTADERNHSKCSVMLTEVESSSATEPALAACTSGFA